MDYFNANSNTSNAEATLDQSMTQRFLKTLSNPCHVGIYCIALTEHDKMGTDVQGFQPFLSVFFHNFVMVKLTTSSISIKKTDKV